MGKPSKEPNPSDRKSKPQADKNELAEEYLKPNEDQDLEAEGEGEYVVEFRHELLDHFLEKADDMGRAHDSHTSQVVNRIEDFEKVQEDHKALYDGNHSNHDERRKLVENIIQHSKNFEDYSKDSALYKRNLRGELDDLEDTLRKLKDNISELEIENKNLQLIAETEQSIQDAKNRAEADAVNAVNKDLKELVGRLAADSEKDISFKEASERIKLDVMSNYRQSENDFNNFLKQAEIARTELNEDLYEIKERSGQRNNDNDELRSRIEEGEVEIDRLNRSIDLLNKEIDNIKRTNNDTLKNLERDRLANENTIAELRKNSEDLRLEQSTIEIGIFKINSQLQYLAEAAKSGGNDLIKKKVDQFDRSVKATERNTEQLRAQLNSIDREWIYKVDSASKEISSLIRESESKAAAEKINQLLRELESKQAQINELKRKRNQIERELANNEPDGTSREIASLTGELTDINKELMDLLREKNKFYEELVQYTRELYELSLILQQNEHEIVKLRLELESLRKEQEEKHIIYEHLRAQIEECRHMLDELSAEIATQEDALKQLQDTLQSRKEEGDELDKLLAERDAEIRRLEAKLEEMNRNRPVEVEPEPEPVPSPKEVVREAPQRSYVADENDEVDKLLAQYINFNT